MVRGMSKIYVVIEVHKFLRHGSACICGCEHRFVLCRRGGHAATDECARVSGRLVTPSWAMTLRSGALLVADRLVMWIPCVC